MLLLRHNNEDVNATTHNPVLATEVADHRLRKHADYQRVYREGRKNFSASMSYFFALRGVESSARGPRFGLTAGKVLGKAVERNRIKRRLRDIVRRNAAIVRADVDIVLHPRRTVLTIEFARLESEVVRILTTIQSAIEKKAVRKQVTDSSNTVPEPPRVPQVREANLGSRRRTNQDTHKQASKGTGRDGVRS